MTSKHEFACFVDWYFIIIVAKGCWFQSGKSCGRATCRLVCKRTFNSVQIQAHSLSYQNLSMFSNPSEDKLYNKSSLCLIVATGESDSRYWAGWWTSEVHWFVSLFPRFHVSWHMPVLSHEKYCYHMKSIILSCHIHSFEILICFRLPRPSECGPNCKNWSILFRLFEWLSQSVTDLCYHACIFSLDTGQNNVFVIAIVS